jgi:hypothetical protein
VLLSSSLALAALLGDGSSRAIVFFSYVEQVGLLAVDTYGEVPHGSHAVYHTTAAAEDQQRQRESLHTWADEVGDDEPRLPLPPLLYQLGDDEPLLSLPPLPFTSIPVVGGSKRCCRSRGAPPFTPLLLPAPTLLLFLFMVHHALHTAKIDIHTY